MEPPYKPSRGPINIEMLHFNNYDFAVEEWKVPISSSYKGKIIFCHGLCEEPIMYGKFFELLLNQGYEVFYYQQRIDLHDSTSVLQSFLTAPKDVIRLDHEENEHVDIADLDCIIEHNLEARVNKNEKLYLMGNGQGAALIICYAIMGKYQDWIKTLICYSPSVRIHEKSSPSPIIQLITPFLAKHVPNIRFIHKVKMDYMTSDPKWTEYIDKVLYKNKVKISIAQYNKMLIRFNSLVTKDFVTRFNPDVSLFIAHGDCNYLNQLEGTQEMFDKLNQNIDKELFVVKGARQLLLHEREEIFDVVLQNTLVFMNKYAGEQYGSVYNSL